VHVKDEGAVRRRRSGKSQIALMALSNALESSLRKLEQEIVDSREEVDASLDPAKDLETTNGHHQHLPKPTLTSTRRRLQRFGAVLDDGFPLEEVLFSRFILFSSVTLAGFCSHE
jgi:hypothetical protein